MKKYTMASVGAVLIVLGTGAAQQILPEKSELTSADIATQIDDDVKTALSRNSAAPSLYEWHKSGFTPADVVGNALALKRPGAVTALCASLSRLPGQDLALFANEIRSPAPGMRLPCAPALSRALGNYWKQVRERLAPAGRTQTPSPASREARKIDAGSPSLKIPVSSRRGANLDSPRLRAGEVALTFDEGPHPLVTPEILATLAEYGVRASFLELGKNALAHPELSHQIALAGHTVGSLTEKYPELPAMPIKDAEIEIRRGRELVAAAAGTDSAFFRFPYGERSAPLDDYLRQQHMVAVTWTIDSQDWKTRDPAALLAHVLGEIDRHRGGVVRFHDVYEQTSVMLPSLLEALKARNYTTVVFTPG